MNVQNIELFNDILERNYYSYYRQGKKQIEFYLSGICNQNCEYCYLHKYQEKLYPLAINNFDIIIQNFQYLINWYIENEFICDINLFSGDWINTKLRQPIFNIFYNSFKNIKQNKRPKFIIIPDNMSFISDEKLINEVQNFIDKMKEIKIIVIFSASIDGKYCDDDRNQHTDEYYKRLFEFCEKNNFLCHPMVSSSNIKNWIQNFLWWQETAPQFIAQDLMLLEVRDESWNNENIADLLNFCNFLIEYKYKNYFNSDLESFTKYLFHSKNKSGYSLERIVSSGFQEQSDKIGCNIQNNLHIRVGDLKFVLCHRLSYKELELGQLQVKENKIIKESLPINLELLVAKIYIKRDCLPCCEQCLIRGICSGFCLGNSYENYRNFLVPTLEVCNLMKAKNSFLIQRYNELGVFDIIEDENINNFMSKDTVKYLCFLKKTILANLKEGKQR